MAFSDLCKISNAYKSVENEADQSERIMEENSMVRDLITKILDETGPTEGHNFMQSPEKVVGVGITPNNYTNGSTGNTFIPSSITAYQDNPLFNFGPTHEQNGFNFPNTQNGFSNGYVNYSESDIGSLLGVDSLSDAPQDAVTPEQLNLLRLAAQEIGGAQFANHNPNKFDDKYFNFFEHNQRNSLPDSNVYSVGNNFNRPSLNLDSLRLATNGLLDGNSYPSNINNLQRFPNKFNESFLKDSQSLQSAQDSPNEILAYLNNMSLDQRPNVPRDDVMLPNNLPDYTKLPIELNSHSRNFQNGDDPSHFKMSDEQMRNKMYHNLNINNFSQLPNGTVKPFNGMDNNYYMTEMMKQMANDKTNYNPNFDVFPNASVNMPASGALNYKPNNFQQQSDAFMPRRDMTNLMMPPRENFPNNTPIDQRANFENNFDNMQQVNIMRQNQELARQMTMLMHSRPPPNQLNVDVSFLHENTPYNLGLNPFLGPNQPVPPPVMPSPMSDTPFLAPFHELRNIRSSQSSSGILHVRLDACYEQWRQLERERKRTEARLALAYPGRAVSSSNSIPVPRLPPCPTRVDRLTVDMLREHTKVLTLMGKMETLRASVCMTQNKKQTKPHEDTKITLLKRGQENSVINETHSSGGADPTNFNPQSWKEDVKNLAEIAPHSEVESAMLAWRNAVASVQMARRRELASHNDRFQHTDPILQLANAVKELAVSARRARCAMWCDLSLTVALAPTGSALITAGNGTPPQSVSNAQNTSTAVTSAHMVDKCENSKQANQASKQLQPQHLNTKLSLVASKPGNDVKEDKPLEPTKPDEKTPDNKTVISQEKQGTGHDAHKSDNQLGRNQRRAANYRQKINQQGRTDLYPRNQRYDNRFTQRPLYHYLATGPIN